MKRWLCLMLAAAWIGAAAPFLASAEEIGPVWGSRRTPVLLQENRKLDRE